MKRGRSTGNPTKAEFAWSRVAIVASDRCWLWTGPVSSWGYGDCTLRGVRMNASRAAFIDANGFVSDGMVVCHRCDTPACCNPAHLFAATQADNLADCRAKGRQVYRQGGEHHRATAKMTPDMVQEARRLYAAGVSQSEIGRRWGIHSSVISRAVRGKSWGHVA